MRSDGKPFNSTALLSFRLGPGLFFMSRNPAVYSFENAHQPSHEVAPLLDLATVGPSEHFVQFYEDDDFLVDAVCQYVASGFRQGHTAIIIATGPHRKDLEQQLVEQAFNLVELHLQKKYLAFDAADTLARFM